MYMCNVQLPLGDCIPLSPCVSACANDGCLTEGFSSIPLLRVEDEIPIGLRSISIKDGNGGELAIERKSCNFSGTLTSSVLGEYTMPEKIKHVTMNYFLTMYMYIYLIDSFAFSPISFLLFSSFVSSVCVLELDLQYMCVNVHCQMKYSVKVMYS